MREGAVQVRTGIPSLTDQSLQKRMENERGTFTKTQGPRNVESEWGPGKDAELSLAMLSPRFLGDTQKKAARPRKV